MKSQPGQLTRSEFADLMEPLNAVAADGFSEVKARVYYEALRDLPRESLAFAVVAYLKTAETAFLPMPGTLRKLAAGYSRGQPMSAEIAWGNLLQMVRRFGAEMAGKAMEEMDSLTREAVRACGGFVALCWMTEDTKGQFRKNFRDAYEKEVKKQSQEELTGFAPRLPDDQREMLASEHARIEQDGRRLEQVPEAVKLTAEAWSIPERERPEKRTCPETVYISDEHRQREIERLRGMKPVLEPEPSKEEE